MKINIQLEIQPGEVQLATELLAVLRQLTDHVSNVPSSSPAVTNVPQLMRSLVESLSDPNRLDSVSSQIEAMLSDPAYGGQAEIVEALLTALNKTVLNIELAKRGQSVGPYLQLLSRLPAPITSTIAPVLTKAALNHLTLKRPATADRVEFSSHAECFAVCSQMKLLNLDGTLQTMKTLMKKPSNQAASITMLRKTIEICGANEVTKCDSLGSLLEAMDSHVTAPELRADTDCINQALGRRNQQPAATFAVPVPVPTRSASGTSSQAAPPVPVPTRVSAATPAPAPVSAPSSASAYAFQHFTTFVGSQSIFSLAYNPATMTMVGGGTDPFLTCWDVASAQLTQQIPTLDLTTICALDFMPRTNTLIACGLGTAPQKSHLFAFDGYNAYQSKGVHAGSITVVKALGPDSDSFVTSETVDGSGADIVGLYDLAATGGSVQGMKPITVWKEHKELISCFAIHPTNPAIFFSGSKDKTVRIWDRRMAQCAGQFGVQDPSTFDISAHGDMVTSLDVMEDFALLSSGIDGKLCYWDIRALCSGVNGPPLLRTEVDGSSVVKVVTSGCPFKNVAAVSTQTGVYLMDLTVPTAPILYQGAIYVDDSRPFSCYHELKWAPGMPYVFCCNGNPGIDILVVAQSPMAPA